MFIIRFSFHFLLECRLEFLVRVLLSNFLKEVYNFFELHIFCHSFHKLLYPCQQENLEIVQIIFINILGLLCDFLFNLVNHFNRVQPQLFCLSFLQSSTSIFVTNINNNLDNFIKPSDACILNLRIIERDFRTENQCRNNLLFAELSQNLYVQLNRSLEFSFSFVEHCTCIYNTFLFTYFEAIINWEVVYLHVLLCFLSILLFANNSC